MSVAKKSSKGGEDFVSLDNLYRHPLPHEIEAIEEAKSQMRSIGVDA